MVDTSKRQTLIFGNGLGMAIDPVGFRLETALEAAWNDGEALDAAAREAIVRCVPGDGDKGPRGEDELGDLQRALDACDTLLKFDRVGCKFLSGQGKSFPKAARRYIHRTAWHFAERSEANRLPDDFTTALASFLKATHSHVATLNYDQLLYRAFSKHDLLGRGYEGPLVDGFLSGKFSATNLHRHPHRTFGRYMHLHGSALFHASSPPEKMSLSDALARSRTALPTTHLVLTHFDHKRAVIDQSEVLRTYWDYLHRGIDESCRVVLFGYSGKDMHLNELLRNACTRGPNET